MKQPGPVQCTAGTVLTPVHLERARVPPITSTSVTSLNSDSVPHFDRTKQEAGGLHVHRQPMDLYIRRTGGNTDSADPQECARDDF